MSCVREIVYSPGHFKINLSIFVLCFEAPRTKKTNLVYYETLCWVINELSDIHLYDLVDFKLSFSHGNRAQI